MYVYESTCFLLSQQYIAYNSTSISQLASFYSSTTIVVACCIWQLMIPFICFCCFLCFIFSNVVEIQLFLGWKSKLAWQHFCFAQHQTLDILNPTRQTFKVPFLWIPATTQSNFVVVCRSVKVIFTIKSMFVRSGHSGHSPAKPKTVKKRKYKKELKIN